jgi:hypothetical protein
LASANPNVMARDNRGNVIGGVRTPAVDVPVSTLSGLAPPGANPICSAFGSTAPFSDSTLAELYHTKSRYLKAFAKSLNKAIAGGFIRPSDRTALLAQAKKTLFSS